MTWDEDLRILGPDVVAEIRRIVAEAPPPSPELIADLRPILAPALQRVLAREAAEERQQQSLPNAA